jgi:hypothetical protein
MRRCDERSKPAGLLPLRPFCPGCTISTRGYDFREGQDEAHPLKELHVDLPLRPWLVAILTLKNRTLSPVVERFIACAREVAKPFAKASDPKRSAGH